MRVVRATGYELEQDYGYGVVRQLFERLVVSSSEVIRTVMFEGAARAAQPALGLRASSNPAAGRGEERYAVVHGLYWVTGNLAAQRPLVIAVDDMQWVDEPYDASRAGCADARSMSTITSSTDLRALNARTFELMQHGSLEEFAELVHPRAHNREAHIDEPPAAPRPPVRRLRRRRRGRGGVPAEPAASSPRRRRTGCASRTLR